MRVRVRVRVRVTSYRLPSGAPPRARGGRERLRRAAEGSTWFGEVWGDMGEIWENMGRYGPRLISAPAGSTW